MSTGVPATQWRNTNGLTEFNSDGNFYITDPDGFYLVDPSIFYVVDTGVIANLIPATVWEQDDSV